MPRNISDEAVRNATGRDWSDWFEFLDQRGADDLSHKEIVALLRDEGGVARGWWCQNVTNEFEKNIGRRETGSTVDDEYQIGVQKTLPIDVPTAWELMTSAQGMREWLDVDEPAPERPGETVSSSSGHEYELRTIKKHERLRLRRTDPQTGASTTVQLTLVPRKTGTSIHFHHEGLADSEERERLREHWRAVAGRILAIV